MQSSVNMGIQIHDLKKRSPLNYARIPLMSNLKKAISYYVDHIEELADTIKAERNKHLDKKFFTWEVS